MLCGAVPIATVTRAGGAETALLAGEGDGGLVADDLELGLETLGVAGVFGGAVGDPVRAADDVVALGLQADLDQYSRPGRSARTR